MIKQVVAGYKRDAKALKTSKGLHGKPGSQPPPPPLLPATPSLHLHKDLTVKKRLGLLSADITILVL